MSIRFLTLFRYECSSLNMSYVRATPVSTIVEPESFEETEEKVEEYKPEHPMLQALDALRSKHDAKEDHLEKYVEVDPYEKEKEMD